jgi:hypothetical protein
MAAWLCRECSAKPRPRSRPCPRCCGWCLVHIELPNNYYGRPYRNPAQARAATEALGLRRVS